jgi:hypothetical protein
MIGKYPACLKCKRLVITETFVGDKAFGWSCEAYPDGNIPATILVGGNPHTEAVDGDHGIRFEPKAEK